MPPVVGFAPSPPETPPAMAGTPPALTLLFLTAVTPLVAEEGELRGLFFFGGGTPKNHLLGCLEWGGCWVGTQRGRVVLGQVWAGLGG